MWHFQWMRAKSRRAINTFIIGENENFANEYESFVYWDGNSNSNIHFEFGFRLDGAALFSVLQVTWAIKCNFVAIVTIYTRSHLSKEFHAINFFWIDLYVGVCWFCSWYCCFMTSVLAFTWNWIHLNMSFHSLNWSNWNWIVVSFIAIQVWFQQKHALTMNQ